MMGIEQELLMNPGKFSIQQLQQGVQTGAFPAYLAIPIIQEKVKTQQQLQLGQLGQGAGQPTVAEQVMSAGTQATQPPGIDQLPSGLPQQYAEGGVVGFAGGEGSLVQLKDRMGRLRYGYKVDPEEQGYSRTRGALKGLYDRVGDRASLMDPSVAGPAGAVDTLRTIGMLPGAAVLDTAGAIGDGVSWGAGKLWDVISAGVGGPEVVRPSAQAATPEAPPPAAATPAPPTADIPPDAQRLIADAAKFGQVPGIDALPSNLNPSDAPIVPAAAPPAATPAAPTDIDAIYKPAFDALAELNKTQLPVQDYSERRAKLDKKEADLATKREENKGLALMAAGFAMMGSKDPSFLGGLGEGAMKGLQAYASGKKDIDALEADIERSREKLDDLEHAGKLAQAQDERSKLTALITLHGQVAKDRVSTSEKAQDRATQERGQDVTTTNARIGADARAALAEARLAAGTTGGAADVKPTTIATWRNTLMSDAKANLKAQLESDPGALQRFNRLPAAQQQAAYLNLAAQMARLDPMFAPYADMMFPQQGGDTSVVDFDQKYKPATKK